MSSFRRAVAIAIAVTSSALASTAQAQTAHGFALDTFNPSERGSDWFTTDSLDLRGNFRPAIGVVGDYGYRPLVLYNTDGSTRSALVRDELLIHPGASLAMWNRLRLAFDLPVALWQQGESSVVNGTTYPAGDSAGIGDLRLGADLRVLGNYRDAFTLAMGAQLFVPTGKSSTYLGDGAARFLPRAQVAGDIGLFAYAANAGFMFRANTDSFGNYPRGNEMTFGASFGVRTRDHKLLVGPEVTGSAVVTGSDTVFSARQTPLEAILGAHFSFIRDWRVGVGGGPGLSRGLGEPEIRAVASIEWMPAIRDEQRPVTIDDIVPPAKPSSPAIVVTPPPADRDRDKVADRDGDGIANDSDACPDQAGPKSDKSGKNGCPLAFVQDQQIKISGQVKFATSSAVISTADESISVLEAVLSVLEQHPEIAKVRVEGHTDNVGSAVLNQRLSAQRAQSVVAWLAKKGVDSTRLSSVGLGILKPIDSNGTADGRQNNRRVEFHIEEQTAPTDAASASAASVASFAGK